MSSLSSKVYISIPVYKDDTRDEKSPPYGKKVCERHVVGVPLQRALWCGAIGERAIVMSNIIRAALLQSVVSVVAIIHHSVCKIALKQKKKWLYEFLAKLKFQ